VLVSEIIAKVFNKKLALIILLFGNLLGAVILWIGYHALSKFFFDVDNQAEVIEFSSRFGFFIVGLPIIGILLLVIIEYYFPALIRKHLKALNIGGIVGLIIFLSSGFFISSWMRSHAENAGYIYCRNASGVSALARALVYTKNMDICEELVASKQK
jgi:uncharacterized Tic20 family protein